nr:hypothetical protein Ccrd_012103 [Ipomoea batatas]
MAVLGSPVRSGAEAGGDAVAIGAIVHAVHNPVTAGFDAGAGSLGELNFHGIIAGGDSGDLSDGEAAISQFSGSTLMQKSLVWPFAIAPSIVELRERIGIEMIRRTGGEKRLDCEMVVEDVL